MLPSGPPWYSLPWISPGELKGVLSYRSVWDRDIALERAVGVPEDAFYRGNAILLGEGRMRGKR